MVAITVPVIPPDSVEVCEHTGQTICTVVAGLPVMWVTAPSSIDGQPDRYGRIVRFEPVPATGEPGAWVRMRNGGEFQFRLRELTLVVEAK